MSVSFAGVRPKSCKVLDVPTQLDPPFRYVVPLLFTPAYILIHSFCCITPFKTLMDQNSNELYSFCFVFLLLFSVQVRPVLHSDPVKQRSLFSKDKGKNRKMTNILSPSQIWGTPLTLITPLTGVRAPSNAVRALEALERLTASDGPVWVVLDMHLIRKLPWLPWLLQITFSALEWQWHGNSPDHDSIFEGTFP